MKRLSNSKQKFYKRFQNLITQPVVAAFLAGIFLGSILVGVAAITTLNNDSPLPSSKAEIDTNYSVELNESENNSTTHVTTEFDVDQLQLQRVKGRPDKMRFVLTGERSQHTSCLIDLKSVSREELEVENSTVKAVVFNTGSCSETRLR